jgi:predicted N-acetyltransferase YhbS
MAEIKNITIRTLKPGDLNALVEIDRKVLGHVRRKYWQAKIGTLERQTAIVSLVAVMNGNVVGFILGAASGWEFGIPTEVGWIDTIGVDPEFQNKGIARELFKEMVAHLKKVGVEKIYTFIYWRDWELLKFWDKMGFNRGEMINLELKVKK